jgi:hypothetical protein
MYQPRQSQDTSGGKNIYTTHISDRKKERNTDNASRNVKARLYKNHSVAVLMMIPK